MQVPVVLGDVFGVENAVLIFGCVLLGKTVANEVGIDRTVDDDMGDVNVHRPQLTGHALRQGTDAVLGAGERGKSCSASHAGGCASEQYRSVLTLGHANGHFTGVEKTRETGHFPDLEILAGGFFQNAARHVGADVENECFDGADLAFNLLDQCHHIVLFARIASKAMGFTAVGQDCVD
ncbi:hypothetical protein D3C87_1523860 [compost metagenome]